MTEWRTLPSRVRPIETEFSFSDLEDPADFSPKTGSGVMLNQVIRDRLHSLGIRPSKYMPHQGKQECARRVRQMEKGK